MLDGAGSLLLAIHTKIPSGSNTAKVYASLAYTVQSSSGLPGLAQHIVWGSRLKSSATFNTQLSRSLHVPIFSGSIRTYMGGFYWPDLGGVHIIFAHISLQEKLKLYSHCMPSKKRKWIGDLLAISDI